MLFCITVPAAFIACGLDVIKAACGFFIILRFYASNVPTARFVYDHGTGIQNIRRSCRRTDIVSRICLHGGALCSLFSCDAVGFRLFSCLTLFTFDTLCLNLRGTLLLFRTSLCLSFNQRLYDLSKSVQISKDKVTCNNTVIDIRTVF